MNDQRAYDYYEGPEPRKIFTVMSSVRFAPEVIEAVKDLAFKEGLTVSSWIRRLVQWEIGKQEPDVEIPVDGLSQPLRVPREALSAVIAAMMPALAAHDTVDLRVGPLGAERPVNLIEGSGRRGEPTPLPPPPSLQPRTFCCPHMSIGNAAFTVCDICGSIGLSTDDF